MPKRRNGVTAIFRARKRPCTATACHATASRRNSPPKPSPGGDDREVQTYTICPLARDDPPSRAVAFGMPSGGGLPSTGALDCSSEQLAAANSIPKHEANRNVCSKRRQLHPTPAERRGK